MVSSVGALGLVASWGVGVGRVECVERGARDQIGGSSAIS
ncbi:hypothetical protein CCACVL1_02615 [Corchorus capsularis]|uniref:Uncharacterized protein n=1 Tax=Corchorus capsularis TaxID=210143 RepID=A0A1R3K7H3_COCAP|nr:hypothetical protein CCACVL1_02615 [Corchorus capsularis]